MLTWRICLDSTPYLSFLKNHPEIKIHAGATFLQNNVALLGLNTDRLVFGPVQADIIYLPQGGGCGLLHPVTGQLLHHYYARYIQQNMHQIELNGKADVDVAIMDNGSKQVNDVTKDSNMHKIESNAATDVSVRTMNKERYKTESDSIILIKRSKTRYLAQHDEVKMILKEIAVKNNMRFEVFRDDPVPSLQ